MAQRFFSEFSTSRGNTWRVNIYDDDFSGTAAESKLAAPGFELEYHGGQDVFSPLMPSTCSVHLMIQSAAEQDLLTDLSDFVEGRFVVEVREDPDGADTRHWIGLLSPESIQIPDQSRPFVIQLQAVCGLSMLSRRDYNPDNQYAGAKQGAAYNHLQAALLEVPYTRSDFFGVSVPYMAIPVDVVPATADSTDNFAEDVYFGAEVYDPELGLRTVGTAEDMLVQILTMLNARIFMHAGRWMLQPVARMMSSSATLDQIKNYDSYLNLVSTTTAAGLTVTIDQVNRHRMAGHFYYLPAIRKISRRINYFGNAPFAGSRQLYPNFFYNVGNTDTAYSVGYSISGSADAELDSAQKIRVKGFAFIQQPFHSGRYWDGSAWQYDPASLVMRWRIELKVRIDDRYLKREIAHSLTSTTISGDLLYDHPSEPAPGDQAIFNVQEPGPYQWTTDSADRVIFWSDIVIPGASEAFGENVSTRVDFDFLSPSIGVALDADVEVEMQCRAYNGQATVGNPDAFISGPGVNSSDTFCIGDLACYLGDGSDSGDVITYAAELDNGATEELQIIEGVYSEGTSDDAYNFSTAALKDSSGDLHAGFKSTETTATTPLAQLLCIDRLHHMGEQQECWRGTLQSGQLITPFELLNFDSKKWMLTQVRYSAEEDLYDADCLKVKNLGTLDPDPVAPSRKSITPVITPGGNAGVLQESINRQELSVNAQIADVVLDVGAKFATGLAELGDVNISALANLHILQYSSGAGEWRNVSLSLNLTDLADVNTGSPTDGDVLTYSSGSWGSAAPSGGGGGAESLPDLDDVNSLISPSPGDMLIWTTANGGQWNAVTIASGVGSQIAMGNLGNVTEGTGSSGNLLVDFNISGAYWITQTPAQWAGSHLPLGLLSNVSSSTPTAGDLLRWSGSQWEPAEAFSYITLQSSFYAADGNGDYIPVGGTLSETTSSNYYTIWTAPADGEVVKATCICQATTAGSSTLRIRKYPVPTWIDSDTQSFTSAYTTGTFTFSTATFSAGDRLQFWFDPTGRPNGVQITLLIKLTH